MDRLPSLAELAKQAGYTDEKFEKQIFASACVIAENYSVNGVFTAKLTTGTGILASQSADIKITFKPKLN